jgi:hypothetical protein
MRPKPQMISDPRPPSPGEGARSGGRGGQGVRALFCALAVCSLLSALPAFAWDVNGDAPGADFHAFHRRFSADAYHYPGHGAAPLGLTGFDVFVSAAVDRGFDNEPFADTVVDGSLSGGFLAVGRVGVRKGLPGGFDIGVAYGQALGGDVNLASADLQWAIIKGGVLSPALSLRFTGTETLSPRAYDLRQVGAEVLFSKGFTVLTPFVGAGIVSSRGKLDGAHQSLRETDTQGIAYAGVTLNLLLPKITVEVEKAEVVQASIRVGIGL